MLTIVLPLDQMQQLVIDKQLTNYYNDKGSRKRRYENGLSLKLTYFEYLKDFKKVNEIKQYINCMYIFMDNNHEI